MPTPQATQSNQIPAIDFSQLNLPHSPLPGQTAGQAPTNQAQVIDPNSTQNAVEQALNQLSDIVLPADIGIWPPAPGWWMVLFFGLIVAWFLIRFLIFRFKRFRQVRKIKKQIRFEIEQTNKKWLKEKNIILTSAELSKLLRRYALFIIENGQRKKGSLKFSQSDIASIDHQQLLNIMENEYKFNGFAQNYSALFSDLMYQDPGIVFDTQEKQRLSQSIEEFIPELRRFVFKSIRSITTQDLIRLHKEPLPSQKKLANQGASYV